MTEPSEGNELPQNSKSKTKLVIDWLTKVKFWVLFGIVIACTAILSLIFLIPKLIGEIHGVAGATNDANPETVSLIYGLDFLPSMFELLKSESISPYMFQVIIAYIVLLTISAVRKFYVEYRRLNIEELRVMEQLKGEAEGRRLLKEDIELRKNTQPSNNTEPQDQQLSQQN